MAFNSTDLAAFKDIWVFCEQREGKLMNTDFELISEARKLADERGSQLVGVLIGHNVKDLAKELGGYGADKVYVCEDPALEVYTTDAYSKGLCDICMDKNRKLYYSVQQTTVVTLLQDAQQDYAQVLQQTAHTLT